MTSLSETPQPLPTPLSPQQQQQLQHKGHDHDDAVENEKRLKTMSKQRHRKKKKKKHHYPQQPKEKQKDKKTEKKEGYNAMSYTQRKQVKRRQRALHHSHSHVVVPSSSSNSYFLHKLLTFSSATGSSSSSSSSSSQVYTTFLVLLTLSLFYRRHSILPLTTATSTNDNSNNSKEEEWKVPFFYQPSSPTSTPTPPYHELTKALDAHATNIQIFINSMLKQEELARKSEWTIFQQRGDSKHLPLLASLLREKIGSIAEILEEDLGVLEGMMKEFECTIGLPAPPTTPFFTSSKKKKNFQKAQPKQTIYTSKNEHKASLSYPPPKPSTPSSYDSLNQVITHLIRDYTHAGSTIRTSLYTQSIQKLKRYVPNKKKSNGVVAARVLIPGAGLGRLGLEVLHEGYNVEMNEISMVMGSAAHYFLHFGGNNGEEKEKKKKRIIHPFAFDLLMNEVDSIYRRDAIEFPDDDYYKIKNDIFFHTTKTSNNKKWWNRKRRKVGNASYTIGDFISTYATPTHKSTFDAILTCFFIDTATNIYEYLLVIHHVLRDEDDGGSGIWINVGPLQWHANAILTPSADELRIVMERGFGFEILEWSVDSGDAVNYRHEEEDDVRGTTRYTKMTESYFPLRFVARKRKKEKSGGVSLNNVLMEEEEEEKEEDVWKVICKMRESIGGEMKQARDDATFQNGGINDDDYYHDNFGDGIGVNNSSNENIKSSSSPSLYNNSVVIEEL